VVVYHRAKERGKRLVRARTGLCVLFAVLAGASSAQQTLPSGTIRTIALDPTDNHYLYVGGDDGVFYSHDSGATWDRAEEAVQVWSLSVFPGPEFGRLEPEILAGTQSRGVLKSSDYGVTWSGDPNWTDGIQSVSSRRDGAAAYAGNETALYVWNEGGPGWEVLTEHQKRGRTGGPIAGSEKLSAGWEMTADHRFADASPFSSSLQFWTKTSWSPPVLRVPSAMARKRSPSAVMSRWCRPSEAA
jgi:hypothetical protein